jgi:hypothetical protein
MSHRLIFAVPAITMILCAALRAADSPAPEAPVPLGNGAVQFTPPSSETWEPSKHQTDKIVAYTTKKHDAMVKIELLPDDMVVDKSATDAILKAIRGSIKSKILLEPTVESDDRFALKIHERYEVGKNDNKRVADVLHIYMYVGKHMMAVTVNSVATEPDAVKAAHKDAEDALLSATGPGVKPRKPVEGKAK